MESLEQGRLVYLEQFEVSWYLHEILNKCLEMTIDQQGSHPTVLIIW